MHISTHFKNEINFGTMLSSCLRESNPNDSFNIYRLVLILSLISGLNIRFIMTLKWNDILTFDSGNNTIVKDELVLRKCIVPIHPKIKKRIFQIYVGQRFPELNTLIVECHPSSRLRASYENSVYLILKFSIPSFYASLFESFINQYDKTELDKFTQVYFGRKVFEVNGYSNEISKKLKQHFELKLNSELFELLEYNSKKDAQLDLQNINLDCENLVVNLEDKNFNNGYPFQKFPAFSSYLFSNKVYSDKFSSDSIKILLLLSLYSGIRPSSFLKLKWDDLLKFDKNDNIETLKSFKIKGKMLKLNRQISELLVRHFTWCKISNEELKENNYVFIMRNGSPITQPSLSREMKRYLNEIHFPHANEVIMNSTLIMYGRRIIEIKGDHKQTIKKLIEHFNFRSKKQLFKFLFIDINNSNSAHSFKGKVRKNMFEEILYDL